MNGMTGPSEEKRSVSARISAFWQRVTEGLELQQLWNQFKSEVQSSYHLYSADVARLKIQETNPWRRNLKMAQQFGWAILMKLTPARRVLLLIAILLLIFPDIGYQFEHGKLETRNLAVLGGVILLIVLLLEMADRVIMKRDLEIARDIQSWLMPERTVHLQGMDVAFASRPANTVAGDYYDVLRRSYPGADLEKGPVLIAVADVVGKSMPAALLMATFQASLRTLSNTACALPEIALGLNGYACQHSGGGLRFTTAFVAEYHPAEGRLTYVNAGHNPPLLRRASGAIERLQPGGLPFGIRAQTEFECRETFLREGDLLVIFTDGLVEAVDPQGREFEEARLVELLPRCSCRPAAEVLSCIMGALEAHVGGARQNDDITLLVMRPVGTELSQLLGTGS
jgi:phosphoserine phosphatase RsbU/P